MNAKISKQYPKLLNRITSNFFHSLLKVTSGENIRLQSSGTLKAYYCTHIVVQTLSKYCLFIIFLAKDQAGRSSTFGSAACTAPTSTPLLPVITKVKQHSQHDVQMIQGAGLKTCSDARNFSLTFGDLHVERVGVGAGGGGGAQKVLGGVRQEHRLVVQAA